MTIITLIVCDFTYSLFYRSCTHDLLDRRTERKAMKKQLVLVIPLLAAMIGMIAIVGLNTVNAQNMSTPETNITSMSNATMGGNMTIGLENMTNSSSPMMTNSS
jgi:hypothetical protein